MQFKVEAEKDGQRQTVNVEANSLQHAHERLERRGFTVLKPVEVIAPGRPAFVQPRLEQGHYQGAPVINIATPRRGNSLGIVSLILGVVAFLICWIPLVNLLGVPLSALGLLLGLIGLIVAFTRKGASIGYPIAGSAVCGLSLFIAISMTGALMGGFKKMTNQSIVDARSRAAANQTADVVPNSTPTASATDWAPADKAVRQGDVQVQIRAVKVGPVKTENSIRGTPGTSEDSLISITIEITNLSDTKKVNYSTWGGRLSLSDDRATLNDNFNNRYRPVYFGFSTKIAGSVESESIYPGKSVKDVIVFEEPVAKVEYLNLELPAKQFGGTGMLRLRIPSTMIQR